jgi:hypothetical protein
MTLAQLVAEFMASRLTGGLVLDEPDVTKTLLKAVRLYAGYAELKHFSSQSPSISPILSQIDNAVVLTPSEWAIIQPLFNAYVDHENALRLEASRGLGLDVYGRSSSELASEIKQLEVDFPRKAFYQRLTSVGNLDIYVNST